MDSCHFCDNPATIPIDGAGISVCAHCYYLFIEPHSIDRLVEDADSSSYFNRDAQRLLNQPTLT